MMSPLCLFLASCLVFFSFLPSRVSSHCQQFPRSTCEQHSAFVPGHNLAGEGVDITTLARKGAYVVDTSQWQDPNGTCTLCENPLMGGQLQRLPLATMDWRVRASCYNQETSSVEHSDLDVAKAFAREIKNEWRIDLGLPEEIGFLKSQVVLAGSQSQMTIYAHKKTQQDRYSFVMHEVSCEYYRLRLHERPSLLSPHFSRAVENLPSRYDPEEYQHVIDTYGTHYISQVQLGGRVRNLLAVRTCEAALGGLTDSDIKDCLTVEASIPSLLSKTQRVRCQELERGRTRRIFREAYGQRRTEIEGGDNQAELLFTEAGNNVAFSEWMETVKTRPGVVSYSLLPIHTLVAHEDPRREGLRKAVRGYIAQRAQWKSCTEQCPYGSYKHSGDSCNCVCPDQTTTDAMCCAREKGIAHLKVRVLGGSDLWADYYSGADAYVRVLFRGQELKTSVIQGDNNPVWFETLDFGPVVLTGHDYIEVQIWDSDDGLLGSNDLLGTCKDRLVGGHTKFRKCHLDYGYVIYYFEVECGPALGGTSCQHYVPQKWD